ncbi:MAG: hypothetical protein L0K86_27250 [Actinomycetia bacterium]|nr:hypothetical protein [Actinomycetes bacterium]
MRGTETPHSEESRNAVGRELEPTNRRPSTHRLHIERPCYVSRHGRDAWAWNCTLCPLPFQLTTYIANDWQSAIEAATAHVRAEHTSQEQALPLYAVAA